MHTEGDVDQHVLDEAIREALVGLQRYLSDELPPMLFAEFFDTLLSLSPAVVGEEIRAWVAGQYRGAVTRPISDYLFHAAKKIHVLRELQLVPRDQLEAFLGGLKEVLLHLCPAEDRSHLENDFAHLDDAGTVLASPVGMVHQRAVEVSEGGGGSLPPLRAATASAPGAAAPSTTLSPAVVRGLRRFELLLQRLGEGTPTGPTLPPEAVLAEAVAEAVGTASDSEDFLHRLAALGRLGLSADRRGIVRLLGSRLPDWAPPPEARLKAPDHGPAALVRKAVDLSRDPQEAARHFEVLVTSAAEEFNQGSLGRAVTLLELASDMVAGRRVGAAVAQVMQSRGEELLESARLREFAEDTDKVPLLRRAMAFFSDLAPTELLAKLERETSRERRRHLLMLLLAHGEEARRLALATLHGAIDGSAPLPWQLERNLLYLLRRLPQPTGDIAEEQLDVLIPLSQPGGPLAVVREALAGLGQLRSSRAEATLIARVAELEEAALGTRPLPYDAEEVLGLLDRTIGALARSSSSPARRCVVGHALKRKPQLGNTLARAAELGEQDLSNEPELLGRLLAAVREELPVKVLGVTLPVGRRAAALEGLITLLAGTPAHAVREVLTEVVERFPGQPFAQAAARALARAKATSSSAPPTPSLAGDLQLFGLPSLLQNFGESRLTGALTVFDGTGAAAGTLRFVEGQIVAASAGPLTGKAAVYQLLTLPLPRFVFVHDDTPPPTVDEGAPYAVLPLVMEGMRRFDEYRRACALLPDQARLRPGQQRPTRPAEEHDVALMRKVWAMAFAGASAAECERDAGVEFSRVRRLLAHWLEEGALELVANPPPP